MTAAGSADPMGGTIHVLLVEDDPGDARLVREALRGPAGNTFTLQHVTRLGEALEHIGGGGVDAVLLDLTLPDSAGLATVDQVQGHEQPVAVVVLTGLDDETTGQLAIERGAQDYLVKGQVDENTLPRVLRYAVERDRTLRRLRELLAEQQAAAEALRHSQERYDTIASAALDAMMIADGDGHIVSWNPAAQRLFGYPEEQARQLNLSELLPPAFRSDLVQAIRRLHRSGEPVFPIHRTAEMPALQADGRTRLAEWSIATWQDDVGRFFSATVRDIADRQEARLLSGLVRAQHEITDAGFDQTRVLRITARWAMALTRASGAGIYTPRTAGEPRRQEVAVGSLADTDPDLAAATTVTVEIGCGGEDGAVLTIDAPEDDGYQKRRHEMLEIVAGFCDAALARAREYAAKQALLDEHTAMLVRSTAQEERFRHAFDDAPISVALIALDEGRGRLLRTNTALDHLLGRSDELAGSGNDLASLAHPEDQATVVAALDRLAHSRETQTFAGRLTVADGTHRHVEGVAAVVHATDTSDPYGVVQLADVTAAYEAQTELRRLALHDSLTGLPNRRLLTDRLTQELRRSQRSGRAVAVMFIDLDGFKPVNDRYGHQLGDQLLQEFTARMLDTIRDCDTAARIGGDEFVVVCEGFDTSEQAYELAERLRERIRAPYDLGAVRACVTASIGVYLANADDAPADALKAADHAMYLAKQAGRDRCHTPGAAAVRESVGGAASGFGG